MGTMGYTSLETTGIDYCNCYPTETYALNTAAVSGNEAVVRLLLDCGANINSLGGYYGNAIQAAASHKNEAVFHLLISRGTKINSQGSQSANML